MNFAISFIITLIAGVTVWVLVGTTLDHYAVHPSWFMVAGFWMYPMYQRCSDAIIGWGG